MSTVQYHQPIPSVDENIEHKGVVINVSVDGGLIKPGVSGANSVPFQSGGIVADMGRDATRIRRGSVVTYLQYVAGGLVLARNIKIAHVIA